MPLYTIKSGDTLSVLAQQNKTTVADLQRLNPNITDPNRIFAGQSLNLPETTPTLESIETGVKKAQESLGGLQQRVATEGIETKPIEPEVEAQDITVGTAVDTGEIPTGGGTTATDAYNKSIQAGLDTAKKAYEDALKTQMDELAKRKSEYEQKITDLETKQEVMLETDVKPLMEPFREKLETTERQRLKIEENYFANQKSIGELENLLTTGQAEIEAIKATPGLAAIKTGQINKKAEDITARAGVIEAVMSARTGQMNMAYTLIDRSVSAIEADRKDQLTYYEAVYKFYQEKKDVAGKKLITLEKDERDYIDKQISDLKDQVKIDQKVVDQIKDAMIDPKTANIYEQAGVKLTDTLEEIQKKLSEYAYVQEVRDKANKMEEDGYQELTEAQAAGKPEGEIARITDSRGKEKIWWKEEKKTTTEITQENRKTEWDSAVAYVEQYKDQYSPEQLEAALRRDAQYLTDSDIKSIIGTTAKETTRSYSDEELISTINIYTKPKSVDEIRTKEEIRGAIQRDKDYSEVDRARALELVDRLYPDDLDTLAKDIRANPDNYKFKDDGIYKVRWGPLPNYKVYSF